jgi:hypothetical protein
MTLEGVHSLNLGTNMYIVSHQAGKTALRSSWSMFHPDVVRQGLLLKLIPFVILILLNLS